MFIKKKLRAFGGIEILLAGSIMTLVMVSLMGLLFYGQDSIKRENLSSGASLVANEGLEAVSSIRDRSFSDLVDGLHGLVFVDGQWELSGESDESSGFNRVITISPISENIKKVSVSVTWSNGPGKTGRVLLYKHLSNWFEQQNVVVITEAEQLLIDSSGGIVNASNRNQVIGVNLSNQGPNDIISIKKMTPIWSGVNTNRRISSIAIGGVTVWSGSEVSGVELTLDAPFELDLLSGEYPLIFNFSRTVDGISLYANFTMFDDSQKQEGMIAGVGADLIPPATINDLSPIETDNESVTLSWTAPGDDDNVGLASYYEIRYSQDNITEANWDSASIFSGVPLPEMAGTVQSIKVDGLSVDTGYYFAIKTTDDSENVSDISNIVYDSTTGLTQAERLLIDSSGGIVNASNRNQVIGVNLSNQGPGQIISIKKIKPTWSGINTNRRISSIVIGGTTVWSGSEVSGTELTLNAPFDLDLSSGEYPLIFNFSRTVDGISLYAGFIMFDDSQKQESMISGTGADLTPPADISNLGLVTKDHESVTLSWTAPGDDGSTGMASYYEIRYSQSNITDLNWDLANVFSGAPLPAMAGTAQSVKVNGLSPNTGYYFAIKTTDDSENTSGLSNIFYTTTNSLPQSSYLQINMSGAVIGPLPLSNVNVSGIMLDNNGAASISIKSISGSWTGSRLREIFINGVSIWSGNLNSGGTATFSTPYVLTTIGGPYNLRLRFQSNFTGQTINYLDFTLFDNSVKRSGSKSF